ncbi:MAG: hypothetical protein V7K78_29340, partial [Nostoc sp.]
LSGLFDTLLLTLPLFRCTELVQNSNRIPIYAQFYALIDNYDPRKEFVVIVGFNYGSDAREYFFLRKPEISPEQAFRIVSDRPLEFGIESL